MSQTEQVKALLKQGWTTPLDALRKASCMRLAARVADLREQGVFILDRWHEYPQTGRRVKEYRIAE